MEEKIIEFVKKNRILYDKPYRKPRYSDVKDKKWSEIAKELNTTTETVKKRWKTLRDKYYRDKKSEATGESIPRWKYGRLLEFLSGLSDKEERVPRPIDEYLNGNVKYEVKCSLSSSAEDAEDTNDVYETLETDKNMETDEICEDTAPRTQSPDASFESIFLKELKEINEDKERSTYEVNYIYADGSHANNAGGKSNVTTQQKNARSCPKKAAALALIPRRNVIPLTPTRAFFNSIGMQVEAANLPNSVLFTLQRKIMNVVHQTILDFEQQSDDK